MIGSDADILICTKSDLVVRDIDLLKKLGQVTVSWSINTLDENFKNDMDSAPSIERRIAAMKQVYDAGIRTICFVSPVFPGITNFEAIFERVKDQCDLFWLENLNLRGGFKKTIMDYIAEKYPDLVPLYDEIYNKHNRSYFEALEVKAAEMAKKYDCPFVDNEMPYGRVTQGHPVIVDYFYHEEIRGTEKYRKKKSLNRNLLMRCIHILLRFKRTIPVCQLQVTLKEPAHSRCWLFQNVWLVMRLYLQTDSHTAWRRSRP